MHYLHQAWEDGKQTAIDDPSDTPHCPHTMDTHENAWWWDGWQSGVTLRPESH